MPPVNPDRLVISLFAPLAAAPRFVRAPDAVVAPVPPCNTAMVSAFHVPVAIVPRVVMDVWPGQVDAILTPLALVDRLVMSLLAPLAAAPRFVRAPDAVVAPVPPYKTAMVSPCHVPVAIVPRVVMDV